MHDVHEQNNLIDFQAQNLNIYKYTKRQNLLQNREDLRRHFMRHVHNQNQPYSHVHGLD